MGFFNGFILSILAVAVIFFLYRNIKHNPEAFSKGNLNKSFYTMGLLALLLIGVVASVVMLLKD